MQLELDQAKEETAEAKASLEVEQRKSEDLEEAYEKACEWINNLKEELAVMKQQMTSILLIKNPFMN